MAEAMRIARQALRALLAFMKRLAGNTPRNDYENIIFSAIRAALTRFGKVVAS